MTFKMKEGLGFDTRVFYTDEVIARKLNGYIVIHNGEQVFIPDDVIDIIKITAKEKNAPIIF